jgi:GNAT superfamily N-acetyltransferase
MCDRTQAASKSVDHYSISSDKLRLDVSAIHSFLTRSYWAPGISRAAVERSIEHSLCFGLYAGDKQVGFARVVTDLTAIAYLADVFILEEYRGRGLSRQLVQYIMEFPDLQQVRGWLLATRDAHGLYAQFGFRALPEPGKLMSRKGGGSLTDSGAASVGN